MEISMNRAETTLTVSVSGRIDTMTAPELEKKLTEQLEGVAHLTLDFSEVVYISSAGLRVLLSTQKKMNRQGDMRLTGANEDLREIFDMTGFSDILTIE